MRLALVGATGMVGQEMIKVLEERLLPITDFFPVASQKSIGSEVTLNGKAYPVISLTDAVEKGADIALFSAGGSVSKEWAPRFAEKGTFVIDNSSAWRMDTDVPLVVPEINAASILPNHKIIANPNCSTIQLVMVLEPLRRKYGLKRVVVSTYQSVTGTGKAAVDQLNQEIQGHENPTKVYPHAIFKNVIPQCDVFDEAGYTKEEWKLMREPKKIMGDESFSISATAVRVPVQGGHSESVSIELCQDFTVEEIGVLLAETHGVILQDRPEDAHYPMPAHSEGKDEVFVGRLRKDPFVPNTLHCWIVADNLRKGAATNAVQIAEYLIAKKFI